jgi:hypothetical protein
MSSRRERLMQAIEQRRLQEAANRQVKTISNNIYIVTVRKDWVEEYNHEKVH